jgi:predicted membrane channel-forming protein YqfA (hemolysin III family)
VWAIAFLGLVVSMRAAGNPSTLPPMAVMAYLVMGLAGLVMLLMWAGALIKLARLSAWGWFGAVLILHLVGLGIIGMVAYATSGPDRAPEIVYRPTVT